MQTIYDVIKRPIITEKSTMAAEKDNRYAFEVAYQANKTEIKTAVEKLFNVKVNGISTLMMSGKQKVRGQTRFKRTNWKKAVVTLAPGQKIQLFEANQRG